MNMDGLKYILAGVLLWGIGSPALAQDSLLTLSLAECRQMALAHNEDLQKADNDVRRAELDKAIAFSAYLPKADATATGVYMWPDMDMMSGMTFQMHGAYMAGIALTQPLYTGGKIRAGNRLAAIGRDCAAENRRKARMQVLADADNAYWTYIAVCWKVRMLEAYRRQMDALHDQAQVGVSAGMATANDLLRIEAKRSEIDYQLQKAENGANLCRLSLCNVLGADLDTEIMPTDTVIALPAATPLDESIALRPELKLLQKQVEASEQQVKSARADLLPQLGLSAGYYHYGNFKLKGVADDGQGNYVPYTQGFEDGNWIVMASVSIPIFHWGEGLRKVKKSRLELQNSRLDLQKNSRLLRIEVRRAVQNVTDSRTLVETALRGEGQATENLRVMRDRYAAGMCTLTDLLDAQSQWQQARSNRIEAQTQYKINETEYLRVTGRLE